MSKLKKRAAREFDSEAARCQQADEQLDPYLAAMLLARAADVEAKALGDELFLDVVIKRLHAGFYRTVYWHYFTLFHPDIQARLRALHVRRVEQMGLSCPS